MQKGWQLPQERARSKEGTRAAKADVKHSHQQQNVGSTAPTKGTAQKQVMLFYAKPVVLIKHVHTLCLRFIDMVTG